MLRIGRPEWPSIARIAKIYEPLRAFDWVEQQKMWEAGTGGKNAVVKRMKSEMLLVCALQQQLIPSRPELDRLFNTLDA